jgi:hypothetical protein
MRRTRQQSLVRHDELDLDGDRPRGGLTDEGRRLAPSKGDLVGNPRATPVSGHPTPLLLAQLRGLEVDGDPRLCCRRRVLDRSSRVSCSIRS